ncbi:MAG: hypothetical protein H6Q04_2774 [Acidobacteria bacterium]|nr:hypothetical protein [Acidobacteriota bacterium]
MVIGPYLRQYEHHQPPPPSKNSTTIMMIKVSCGISQLACYKTPDCSLAFVSSALQSDFTVMKTAGRNIQLPSGIRLPPGMPGISM